MRRPPLTTSTPVSDRAGSKGEYQGATRVDVPRAHVAEVFEAAVDRLGRAVGRAGQVEERENVRGALLQCCR